MAEGVQFPMNYIIITA